MRSSHQKSWIWLSLAFLTVSPAVVLRGLELFDAASPPSEVTALFFGLAILGAAFLLAWATQVAELDLPRALALSILALVAVLPEYAVDLVFAYKAGGNPEEYAHLAAANMTGANRLLVGVGWPLIFLFYWLWSKRQRTYLTLEKGNTVELSFLGIATLYSFVLFFKGLAVSDGRLAGRIDIIDTTVLVGIFLAYIVATARSAREEPHLVGPAAAIASFKPKTRRMVAAGLLSFAAFIILMAAEPFAEGLVSTGKQLGISEFLLVQWIAPLASEAPEITIIGILVFQGLPTSAMTAVIASKVNHWTLLVGTLPVVFSIGAGRVATLPLNDRQAEEFFLTSAQSLFAVVLLSNLRLSWAGALGLFLLFIVQLGLSTVERSHLYYGIGYLVLTLFVASSDGRLKSFMVMLPVAFRSLRSPIVMTLLVLFGSLLFVKSSGIVPL